MATFTRDTPLAAAEIRARRPVSPHLQVYRPLINMMMSIAHRLTGAGLYVGMIGLTAWLLAAAIGPGAYDAVTGLIGSVPGRVLLFGFSWALIHHLLGGIRHLIWDTGAGLDIPSVDLLSWATIVGSVALTVLVWLGAWAAGAL